MKHNYISYSQYRTWKTCPYQWKLIYIDGNKITEPNVHSILGSALHKTIQEYLEIFYSKTEKEANNLDLNEKLLNYMLNEINSADVDKEVLHRNLSQEKLLEYYKDGIEILDYFKRKKSDYFFKRGYKLIGIELPLKTEIQNGLYFIANLDIVTEDLKNKIIKIIDIKKSYSGWNESAKSDKLKRGQLQLYKYFYHKINNIDINKIEIEYLILKQKIFGEDAFYNKRIQKFSPPSSDRTLNLVVKDFYEFVNIFENGNIKDNIKFDPKPSKENCSFCPFKHKKNLCKYGV